LRGPVQRQLLRGAEFRGLHGRLLRVCAEGRALPHGAVHLLPDQRGVDRPVRAYADRGGRGEPRELPRGLLRARARREPAGRGQNTYRGLVKILKGAEQARNYSQCDSMLIGDKCGAHTFPYIDVRNSTAIMEHEASTSKIGEDQIFYAKQRGLSAEDAVSMI